MGIFKKSLAVVLAALMLVSVFTVAAFAEDGATVVRGTLPNCDWDGNYDADNTLVEGSITYNAVAAGSYQFKVVENGEWYGVNGNNVDIVVSQESDLTITFNAETKEISFSGTYVSAPTGLTVEKIQLMGTVPGATWDFADAAEMAGEDNVYTVTFNNVAAGDYVYKFAANGSWAANWGAASEGVEDLSGDLTFDGKNIGLYLDSAKDVTFKLDLSAFDYNTKTGAKYEVTLADPAEETTAPAEETTAPAEETTAPAEETTAPAEETTAPAEETTAPVEETTAPVEPTEAPKPDTPDTPDTPATPDTPDTTPTTPAKPIVPGFYVVGSEEVCGLEWENDDFAHVYTHSEPMQLSADGVTYYKVYDNIKASAGNVTDEGNDIYVFKVVYIDELGKVTWHPGGMGNNTKVTVAEDGSTVFFQFKLLASRPTKEGTDPEAVIATVYGPNDEKPEDFSKVPYPSTPEETTVEPTTAVPTQVEPTTAAPTQPATEKKVTAKKKANTITVTAKKVTVKAKKLKKKAQKVKITKALKVTKAKGTVTYAKVKKGSTKKFFKKVKIAKKSGKITIKKGKLKKGTYKLKIKVTAAGTKNYKKKSVSKVVKFRVR